MSIVYHYTDTARLPWILHRGELRPGRNKIGDFPDPDFLWATTSPLGDRSCSASRPAFRNGTTLSVRFTLRETDFLPWPAITDTHPAWTPEQIARLEHAAQGDSRPVDWRCRVAPLPASSWLAVHTRSYTDKRWHEFDVNGEVMDLGNGALGVWIGQTGYFSAETEHPSGATAYEVFRGKKERAA